MTLNINPILATDSYKPSHFPLYPAGTVGAYAYIEPRVSGKVVVPFGLQIWLREFMSIRITQEHITEAKAFLTAHGEPFNEVGWQIVVDEYKGKMPVIIRAVPEGLPVPSGNVIVSIESTDHRLFWLPSYLETTLLRAVWYPTTIATLDREIKQEIVHLYRVAGLDPSAADFALHDFGARGVTSSEQAKIGGAAHLVSFKGSDTIEGIRAANYYYNSPMAAYSVPATEHSIECSFGSSPDDERRYIQQVLKTYGSRYPIVSIVIDGYDVYRAAKLLCTEFREEIIALGTKVVFRPDSGDMMEVVPRILDMQAKAFGFTLTSAGYKRINTVGILQGDGVDRASVKNLLGLIMSKGYSPDCVVFGSGGSLLQMVNRDTLKFAQKTSAILKKSWAGSGDHLEWLPISKNPITDPGKKSKEGCVELFRSSLTGEYRTLDTLTHIDSEWLPMMQTVYDNGAILNTTTLEEVRGRAQV